MSITSLLSSAVFMRRTNGWLAVFWLIMIPLSFVTGLVNSVAYVSAISLWALVASHWSAWQAARVEVHMDDDASSQDVIDVIREKQ